ncbi:precorrin-2 dehydrogenase/sirohydrochlorin ferrochelatase family protein [Acinetobacter silvestris]|uniref:precorrin-2 dehydrogenase/sirohydrochlorin ferrochelatase family protein n=1 Tax=Acinetobacter silvestris TaxID=1977882 RepID=UPI0026C1AA8E
MDIFPISLKLQQQPCLVVGGGHIAYRKAVLLAKAGAVISVIAPEVDANLLEIVVQSQGQYVQATFEQQLNLHNSKSLDLRQYRLVIAATDSKLTNQQIFEVCEAENVLVNSVDDPPHCRFMVPAIVDRLPLVISIATNCTSPVLSRQIRTQLEATIP